MAQINIAIDFGTAYTSIYFEGNGIVYRQPTVAAFHDTIKPRGITAFGDKAQAMTGKAPERIIISRPVSEGIIVDRVAAASMLKAILKELIEPTVLQPRIRAIVTTPCGLTILERKELEDVCFDSGILEVILIESILAAAVGIDAPIATPNGGLVVNIGGGTTEIAAISLCGIVSGCTLNVGGMAMDQAIIEFVKCKNYIEIGEATANMIKETIGSLFGNDGAEISVSGQDMYSRKPVAVTVKALDVLDAVLPFYHKVADGIESMINLCPPEIASVIYKTGVSCTGGGALMLGFEEMLEARLNLNATIVADSKYSVILGAGKLLSDSVLLESILNQN